MHARVGTYVSWDAWPDYGAFSVGSAAWLTPATSDEYQSVSSSWKDGRVRRSLAAVVFVLAVAVTTAAVAWASRPDPKNLVLRLADMPTGFSVKKAHYESITQAAKDDSTPLATFKRYGYIAGYEADYDRDVSLTDMATGAIEIDSIVVIYRDKAGPSWGLQKTGDSCHTRGKLLSVGARIGDDALLCSVARSSGGTHLQVYVLSWRDRRFRGTVLLAGVAGGVSPSQAVRLAKLQEARITTAR